MVALPGRGEALLNRLQQMLNVRREEWRLLSRFLVLFCVLNALIDGIDVLATSDYVLQIGTDAIPLIWAVVTVLLVVVSGGYALVADRFPRQTILRLLLVIFGCLFLGAWLLLVTSAVSPTITYTMLYLVTNIQAIVLPVAFWPFASDHYNVSNSARLFPLIATAGLVGKILGSWLAGISVGFFHARGLNGNDTLLIGGAVLLLAAVLNPLLVTPALVKRPGAASSTWNVWATWQEGLEFVREVPLFRYLAIVFALNQAVITILDYQYLVVGAERFPHAADFSAFFGGLRALWNGVALTLQLLIAGRLTERLGTKHIFTLVPAFLVAGMAVAAAIYTFFSVVTVRFLQSACSTAFERPARKAVQGLVPEGKRGRVTTFVDSFLFALAQITGCAVLGIGIGLEHVHLLSASAVAAGCLGLGAVGAGAAVYFAMRLRQVYDASLVNWRLARRKRSSAVSQLDL